MLVGEPYWRREVPDQVTAEGCRARGPQDFLVLPGLIGPFGDLGYDVVEMVLADQGSWDRYQAAQWPALRRRPDAHPGDELAPEFRPTLDTDPLRDARYQREFLGWGVFALMRRWARRLRRLGEGGAGLLSGPAACCPTAPAGRFPAPPRLARQELAAPRLMASSAGRAGHARLSWVCPVGLGVCGRTGGARSPS